MLTHQRPPDLKPNRLPLVGQSSRPALTHLVLLATADPSLAEHLLQSNDAADTHPHYGVVLDEQDQATLDSIRDRVETITEFLASLADAAEGLTV